MTRLTAELSNEQKTLFRYAIKYLFFCDIIRITSIEENFKNYVVIQTLFFHEFIELHLDELKNTVFNNNLLGTNLVLSLNEFFNFNCEVDNYELYSETTVVLRNLTTNEVRQHN